MDQKSSAQSVALALGAVPLQPVLPDDDKIEWALRKLEKVRQTKEYRALVEARRKNEITTGEFNEAVRLLTNRLDAEGRLD